MNTAFSEANGRCTAFSVNLLSYSRKMAYCYFARGYDKYLNLGRGRLQSIRRLLCFEPNGIFHYSVVDFSRGNMDAFKVIVGLRGAKNAFFEGYTYSKRRGDHGSRFVTWRCSQSRKLSCPGSLKTTLQPVSHNQLIFDCLMSCI